MKIANFRTNARVIDLLGRQQIADTPTAMGELMKNALDAGARNFWADYCTRTNILALRDDGIGMRVEDVLSKWLVIATDSKLGKDSEDNCNDWLKFADKLQKKWCLQEHYGEKGIGRLSISNLGSGTLLWTVWGDGKCKEGTLCVVNWDLFQCPALHFEDIPITYEKFERCPTQKQVKQFLSEYYDITSRTITRIGDGIQAELSIKINETGTNLLKLGDSLGKLPWETGTSFYITSLADNVSYLFKEDYQKNERSRTAEDEIKSFYAFSSFWNPFCTGIEREFRIHPLKNGEELKRANQEFWKSSDFQHCDHHISIDVDSNGFASGILQDYKQEPKTYARQLSQLVGTQKSPGPFHVEIGYVQGSAEISPLPKELHHKMSKRLEVGGGFSVYLNNVRVQPYGLVDNDFMGFEARRSLNAGRYYFSHRRMFGGVFIPSKESTGLREKAGREGFINNASFRGLKQWLFDLFIDLADSYYGSKSGRTDKLERKSKSAASATSIRLRQLKSNFISELHKYIEDFPRLLTEAKSIVRSARFELSQELDVKKGFNVKQCRTILERVRDIYFVVLKIPSVAPAGVLLDTEESAMLMNLQNKKNELALNLEKELCHLTQQTHVIMQKANQHDAMLKQLTSEIDELWKEIQTDLDNKTKEIRSDISNLNNELYDFQTKVLTECKKIFNDYINGISITEVAEDSSGKMRVKWEQAIQIVKRHYIESTLNRIEQLKDDLSHACKESSSVFILSEMTRQIERLKEENSFLIDMAQIGLIFESSDHEYNSHMTSIHLLLDELMKKVSKENFHIVKELKCCFGIIEERISMFDPLFRVNNSSSYDISGIEIRDFLNTRLELDKFDVNLICTDDFLNFVWKGIKTPIFLGAIHNLVQNAMYWVKKSNSPHQIKMSVTDNGALLISDSGPGIPMMDRDRIFLPGFSRKRHGRGLGLYIAKEALLKINYILSIAEHSQDDLLDGAAFAIVPIDINNCNDELYDHE